MSGTPHTSRPAVYGRATKIILSVTSALMLSACASIGNVAKLDNNAKQLAGYAGQSELARATTYWAQVYGKNPRNTQAALNYAMNLKAMGRKDKAFSVLQQASLYNRQDRRLASEYGRLALSVGKPRLASKVLQFAHDPKRPDWRVVSAQGTAQAKLGYYKQAQTYFKQALQLSPNNNTIMNNLALAYALDGNATDAEPLLRQAAQSKSATKRVKQNLALVLGLQGRYEEATQVAGAVIPVKNAKENSEYLRKMVDAMPQAHEQGPTSIVPVPGGAAGDTALRGTQTAAAAPNTGSWSSKVSLASAKR